MSNSIKYLYHAEEWANHKYIDKIKSNGKTKYIYELPQNSSAQIAIEKGKEQARKQEKQMLKEKAEKKLRELESIWQQNVRDKAVEERKRIQHEQKQKSERKDRWQKANQDNNKFIRDKNLPDVYYDEDKEIDNKQLNTPLNGDLLPKKIKRFDEFINNIDSHTSQLQDVKAVNPEYKNDTTGEYSHNCIECTLAYEMRRRGYDVEAIPDLNGESDATEDNWYIEDVYKDVYSEENKHFIRDYLGEEIEAYLPNDEQATEHIKNSIKEEYGSELSDARGSASIYWKNGGGHSFVWEMTDDNLRFYDCQTGQEISITDYTSKAEYFYFVRTDNLTLTEYAMNYVRPREERIEEKRVAQRETIRNNIGKNTSSGNSIDAIKKVANKIKSPISKVSKYL